MSGRTNAMCEPPGQRPSLCLDTRKLAPDKPADIGLALYLLERSSGAADPRQEDDANKRNGETLGLYTEPTIPNGGVRLAALIGELNSGVLIESWKAAVVSSMALKESQYLTKVNKLYDEIRDQGQKVATFVRLAKLPVERLEETGEPEVDAPPAEGRAPPNTALADADEGKWGLAKDSEGPFQRWRALIATKASLEVLQRKARQRREGIGNSSGTGKTDLPAQRSNLVESLKSLEEYKSQSSLLDLIVDIVRAFISKPQVSQNSFINMVLMGNPGTGKTRLARAIAQVLGSLGMFIYGGDDYVESGRSEFIAQFEGQTAIKTQTFLLSNLEKVVFLDEAYSLTKYDQNGQLEAYGAESTTEIVAFLSQNVGKIAMIVAGYESQMRDEFLTANDGLLRRFPYQIVLEDYTGRHMVDIFLKSLVEAVKAEELVRLRSAARPARRAAAAAGAAPMDEDEPPPPAVTLPDIKLSEIEAWFTFPAKIMLADICDGARRVITTPVQDNDPRIGVTIAPGTDYERNPVYDLLNTVFAAQAGAMVNLANVAAILLMADGHYNQLGVRKPGVNSGSTWAVSYKALYNIVLTLLQRSLAGKYYDVQNVPDRPSVFGGGGGGGGGGPPPPGGDGGGGGGGSVFQPRQVPTFVEPDAEAGFDEFLSGGGSVDKKVVVEKVAWIHAKEQLDMLLEEYGWLRQKDGGLYYWSMGVNMETYIDTEHPLPPAAGGGAAGSSSGGGGGGGGGAPPPPAALPAAALPLSLSPAPSTEGPGPRRGRSAGR